MLHLLLNVVRGDDRGARRRRASGFTLIELLVVVAIIGILIAVLLPALGRARTAARITSTLANLRDIGIGMQAYSNDFRDRRPVRADAEEKAVLGLAVLAKYNEVPPESFVNPATLDSPASMYDERGRPVLVELDGAEVTPETSVTLANIMGVAWHCSFSYDNDPKKDHSKRSRVYMGDRADYTMGRTMSAAWHGKGQCLLWTDGHTAFWKTRSVADQGDPNVYHHNEYGVNGDGEGADEERDSVRVTEATADTHMRFFSEEEDDELLPD